MLSDVHGQVPIVAGLGVRGTRFCNSNACAWHWKQPIFVTIKRTSNGIEEIIDNGAFDFQLVKGMTRADQFLYNWLYWNPGGLRKLLQGTQMPATSNVAKAIFVAPTKFRVK